MADYNRSEAYDLSLFAVPAYKPDVQTETQQPSRKPRLVKTPKTAEQLRKESIASAIHTLKIFVVAVTLLALFGAVLFSRITRWSMLPRFVLQALKKRLFRLLAT